MAKRMIPLAAAERLLKTSGAERISDNAILSLTVRLELHGKKIAKRAWEFSKHAKRKTVTKDDIDLACIETECDSHGSCLPSQSNTPVSSF
jgi:histone H3/H4